MYKLRATSYGLGQSRQRIYIVGVRSDVADHVQLNHFCHALTTTIPEALEHTVRISTVQEAANWVKREADLHGLPLTKFKTSKDTGATGVELP